MTITHTNALHIDPLTDQDTDCLVVDVTGSPKLWWDESANMFKYSVGCGYAVSNAGGGVGTAGNYASFVWNTEGSDDNYVMIGLGDGTACAAYGVQIKDAASNYGDHVWVTRNSSNYAERMRLTEEGYLQFTGFATERLDLIDAGSAGATEQDWIQVKVGGNTGYIRVYAAK